MISQKVLMFHCKYYNKSKLWHHYDFCNNDSFLMANTFGSIKLYIVIDMWFVHEVIFVQTLLIKKKNEVISGIFFRPWLDMCLDFLAKVFPFLYVSPFICKKMLIRIYAAVLGFSILPSIDPFCPLILICRVSSTDSICSFFSLHQWNLFKLTYSLLKWSSFFNSNTQFKASDWPTSERGGAGQMWATETA